MRRLVRAGLTFDSQPEQLVQGRTLLHAQITQDVVFHALEGAVGALERFVAGGGGHNEMASAIGGVATPFDQLAAFEHVQQACPCRIFDDGHWVYDRAA